MIVNFDCYLAYIDYFCVDNKFNQINITKCRLSNQSCLLNSDIYCKDYKSMTTYNKFYVVLKNEEKRNN